VQYGLVFTSTLTSVQVTMACPSGSTGNVTRLCCGSQAHGILGPEATVCSERQEHTWHEVDTSLCIDTALQTLLSTFSVTNATSFTSTLTSLRDNLVRIGKAAGLTDLSAAANILSSLRTFAVTPSNNFIAFSGGTYSIDAQRFLVVANALLGNNPREWLTSRVNNASSTSVCAASLDSLLQLFTNKSVGMLGLTGQYVDANLAASTTGIAHGNFTGLVWPSSVILANMTTQQAGDAVSVSSALSAGQSGAAAVTISQLRVPLHESVLPLFSNVFQLSVSPSVPTSASKPFRLSMTPRLTGNGQLSLDISIAKYYDTFASRITTVAITTQGSAMFATFQQRAESSRRRRGLSVGENNTISITPMCLTRVEGTTTWASDRCDPAAVINGAVICQCPEGIHAVSFSVGNPDNSASLLSTITMSGTIFALCMLAGTALSLLLCYRRARGTNNHDKIALNICVSLAV
jgi:hypothetical protein